MIPVDSLLYKIDQKLNKLSTNEYQQIQLEDKILSLNEGQIKLVKQKLDGPATPSTLGLDAFRKRYEDLQKLIENYFMTAIESKNPMILKTFEEYRQFKNNCSPNLIDVNQAYNFDGSINIELAIDFLTNNNNVRRKKAPHATILCYAPDSVKNFIFQDKINGII